MTSPELRDFPTHFWLEIFSNFTKDNLLFQGSNQIDFNFMKPKNDSTSQPVPSIALGIVFFL